MAGPWEKYQSGPWEKYAQKDEKPPVPMKIGADRLAEDVTAEAASRSIPAQMYAGAGTALDNMALRLKQAVSGLSTEDEARVRNNRALADTPAGMVGSVAGNLGLILSPGVALQNVATQGAARVLPAVLAPTAGAAATGATLAAATNPVLSGESEAMNAGLGALGGALGDVAGRGLARVARPTTPTPEAARMAANGIAMTPGQASGPRSIINKVEQQLESIPVIGWFITGARERAVREANVEAIKKALPQGADAAGIKAGRESIQKAGEVLDDAYNAVYSRLSGKFSADDEFRALISSLPKKEGVDLPPSLAKRFDRLMQDRVFSRLEDGATPDAIRDAQNSLGALARKYRGSIGSVDEQALGRAFAEAKTALREMITRQSSGDFRQALEALDGKYSALLAVEKAAGYQGSKGGEFSMEALKRASAKSSPAMRDFANTASDVLGRTVPDSGTAGRTLTALAPYIVGSGSAAGASANEYLGGPGWVTGLALAPLMYSRMGARYMTGAYPGQAAFATTLRDLAPYMAQGGRALAGQ